MNEHNAAPNTAQATHYEVLGCAPTATAAEIKAAYQKAALRLHPDKQRSGGDGGPPVGDVADTQAEYQRVHDAWQVLRDPGLRAAYDGALTQAELALEVTLQDDDIVTLAAMEACELDGLTLLTHPCRCGDSYTVSREEVREAGGRPLLVPCSTCSNHIQVMP